MEVHLVHYKTEYGNSLSEAIAGGGGKEDTLAVLGIMYEDSHGVDNEGLLPVQQGDCLTKMKSQDEHTIWLLLSVHSAVRGVRGEEARLHQAVSPGAAVARRDRQVLPVQRVPHHAWMQRNRSLDRFPGT